MRMQFVRDTQAPGRFFPEGAQVEVQNKEGAYTLMPDSAAYTTECELPAENLVPLLKFDVVLFSNEVGIHEQEVWGVDENTVRASILERAPDCTIVQLVSMLD
ncbi:hypothetical protein ACLUS7_17320 [Enterobacterales bacterium BD_CKDN230030183-1A_HGKHYDSX7]